jgi:hypothetical protein
LLPFMYNDRKSKILPARSSIPVIHGIICVSVLSQRD